MTITYAWSIDKMVCLPENNLVVTVFYTVTATNGEQSASLSNVVGVSYQPDGNFTPYSELDQNTVIGWVQDNLGPDSIANIETNLQQNIEALITPPVISLPPPWA